MYYIHVVEGCFHPYTNSLFLQRVPFTEDNPPASLYLPASFESIYAFIHLPVTTCVQPSMKKLFRLGFVSKCWGPPSLPVLPPPSITFSLFLPLRLSADPALAGPDGIPQRPTITTSPLWFWVGTGLGNWSLWALQAYPTVGWTESPLRRQLLGHPRQAERQGERDPVAANH